MQSPPDKTPEGFGNAAPTDHEIQKSVFEPIAESIAASDADTADAAPRIAPQEKRTEGSSNNPSKIGDYTVERRLNNIGMGTVYVVRNPFFDRLEVLKVIRKKNESEIMREQFLIEMRTLAMLEHPNIVKIHYAGEHEGKNYFTMEYLECGDLSMWIAARLRPDRECYSAPLNPTVVARMVMEVAKAVAFAHSKGVIHLDLKPANVLLTKEGHPKLADFGLANSIDRESMKGNRNPIGTPAYMSPEQAAGDYAKIDSRSDVYGLGCIFYELLTGRPPYGGASITELIEKVNDPSQSPKTPREIDPSISPALEAICLKCMAKNPVERYQTTEAVVEDLRIFLRPGWVRRNIVRLLIPGLALTICTLAIFFGKEKYNNMEIAKKAKSENIKKAGSEYELALTEYMRENKLLSKPLFENAIVNLTACLSYNDKDVQEFPLKIATSKVRLAEIKRECREYGEAKGYLDEAYKELEELLRKSPENLKIRYELAELHHQYGCYFASPVDGREPDYHQSEDCHTKSRDLLAQINPIDIEGKRKLARSYGFLGDPQIFNRKWLEAEQNYLKAQKIRDEIAKSTNEAKDFCMCARDFGNLAALSEWQSHLQPNSNRLRFSFSQRIERFKYLCHNSLDQPLPADHRTERADTCLDLVELAIDLIEADPNLLNEVSSGLLLADTEYKKWNCVGDPAIVSGLARLNTCMARYFVLNSSDSATIERYLIRAGQLFELLYSSSMDTKEDNYNHAVALALNSQIEIGERKTRYDTLAIGRLENAQKMGYNNYPRLLRDTAFKDLKRDTDYKIVENEIKSACPIQPSPK